MTGAHVGPLLDHVLAQDLADEAATPPFLVGRALWLASKCAPDLSRFQHQDRRLLVRSRAGVSTQQAVPPVAQRRSADAAFALSLACVGLRTGLSIQRRAAWC